LFIDEDEESSPASLAKQNVAWKKLQWQNVSFFRRGIMAAKRKDSACFWAPSPFVPKIAVRQVDIARRGDGAISQAVERTPASTMTGSTGGADGR
jgi:hypothetical protein